MTAPAPTVFLMYHELELPGRALCQSDPGYVRYILTAEQFRNHLHRIEELGMRGVSVGDALSFPQSSIAITFDDGCETDFITAARLLHEHNFNATFFVVVGFLGKAGYLSLSQLHNLSNTGFEIGCHSMTHPYLPDLDDAGLQREIEDAKVQLEQILGKTVDHFSCPGGRYDSRAMQIAKQAGFRSVCTSIPRANTSKTDKFSLGRVAILRELSDDQFDAICRGESLWRLSLRSELRDRAKRILGNTAYDRMRALILKH